MGAGEFGVGLGQWRGGGDGRSFWPKFILPTFLPARARGSILAVAGGDRESCVRW